MTISSSFSPFPSGTKGERKKGEGRGGISRKRSPPFYTFVLLPSLPLIIRSFTCFHFPSPLLHLRTFVRAWPSKGGRYNCAAEGANLYMDYAWATYIGYWGKNPLLLKEPPYCKGTYLLFPLFPASPFAILDFWQLTSAREKTDRYRYSTSLNLCRIADLSFQSCLQFGRGKYFLPRGRGRKEAPILRRNFLHLSPSVSNSLGESSELNFIHFPPSFHLFPLLLIQVSLSLSPGHLNITLWRTPTLSLFLSPPFHGCCFLLNAFSSLSSASDGDWERKKEGSNNGIERGI